MKNVLRMEFSALAENEAFARAAAAAFVMPLDPTVEELTEIKTAVSEAVSNCVIHGYGMPEKRAEKRKAESDEKELRGKCENAEDNKSVFDESGDELPKIMMECVLEKGGRLTIKIEDNGVGIENVEQAMEPLFTTGDEEERSGMGFTVMESFMDKLKVRSAKGKGTTVIMTKYLDILSDI